MSGLTRTERSLTIVRRLQASREAVFQAWTDPDHLLGWFADLPSDTPTTVDLRVGGAWRLHMVESGENHYMTGGIYREIVPPERLVFTWGVVDGWPPLDPDNPDISPIATIILKQTDNGAEMTFTVDFPDQLSDDDVRAWFDKGIALGWNNTIDRLQPHLAAATH
jgi:uncharacterized protein YndB with AHSA1/START domain